IAASRSCRSALLAARRRRGSRGRMRSRHVTFLLTAERVAGARDLGRIDSGAQGKRDQETLIAEHMLEHAGEEAGLARRGPNLLRRYSGGSQKASQPFGVFGDEAKRLNRQHFSRFRHWSQGGFHRFYLPFRNISALACMLLGARIDERSEPLQPGGAGPNGQARGWGMAKTVLIVE